MLVSLDVATPRPIVVGIIAHDPSKPYTHYIRRKAPVDSSRSIQIPLPVSPSTLLLDVTDKDTGTDRGIRVKKVSSKPMPRGDIWAEPERHRFMEFAIDFAQKAGYVKPGFYPSKNHEFLIHYLPTITDETGSELITPARIHRHMPRVQLSQRLFKQFSVPVRVAILAHEGCHYFRNTRSEKEADLCGIRYYLDYGFPTIEAIYAATQVFLKHPDTISETHINRTRDIEQFIRDYRNNKTLNATR